MTRRRGRGRRPRLRPDPAQDVRDEITHHTEETIELLVAEGWDEEAAHEEAQRRFGPVDVTVERLLALQASRARRMGFYESVRSVLADLKFGLRALVRNRMFAVSVVLTLAIAAGTATAVFSVLDAVLLRPLPYADPERLVEVHMAGSPNTGMDAARYREWTRAGDRVFEGWAAYSSRSPVRTDGAAPEPLLLLAVTPGAEHVLGIPLLYGRSFTAEEGHRGAAVALLTQRYFERLGRDPSVVGSTIQLDTVSVTVVGVLAGGIRFPDYGSEVDLWVPIGADLTVLGEEARGVQGAWARLRDSVSLAAARDEVVRIQASLEHADPRPEGWGIDLLTVGRRRASDIVGRSLWLLSGTVGLMLLVAAMNCLNLVAIRTLARSRELGIRTALGASRGRVRRQLLVEGLALGGCAAAGAAAVAWVTLAGIGRLVPRELTFFSIYPLGVERRAFLFALTTSFAIGAVMGALPSVVTRLERPPPGGGGDDSRPARRLRSALVVGQVALSSTLVAAGAVFVASFLRLVDVDPGFDFEHLAQAEIGLPTAHYHTEADRAQFFSRLEEALEARPDVDGVTMSVGPAFDVGRSLEAEDQPARPGQPQVIPYSWVPVNYLDVTGTQLIAGRPFEPEDAHRYAAIVDVDLARFLWGTEDVVGLRFRIGTRSWTEVVGVVRDLRMMGRDQRQGPYQILYPFFSDVPGFATLLVHTPGNPRAVLPAIRREVHTLDPELPVRRLRTAQQALGDSEQTPRFLAVLMSLLAGIGVALAAVGVFGVLGYSVQRRERELGVRKALGAQRGALLRMVLGDGIALGGAGILLGIGGALLASRFAESLLYGASSGPDEIANYLGSARASSLLYEVTPTDPYLLVAPALLLLLVIAAASLLPARKATRVDPVEALRAE